MKRRGPDGRHFAQSHRYPPLKDGGPIEAAISISRALTADWTYPPLKDGGPIEAKELINLCRFLASYPPLKDGGPIEATFYGSFDVGELRLSAVERRRPH